MFHRERARNADRIDKERARVLIHTRRGVDVHIAPLCNDLCRDVVDSLREACRQFVYVNSVRRHRRSAVIIVSPIALRRGEIPGRRLVSDPNIAYRRSSVNAALDCQRAVVEEFEDVARDAHRVKVEILHCNDVVKRFEIVGEHDRLFGIVIVRTRTRAHTRAGTRIETRGTECENFVFDIDADVEDGVIVLSDALPVSVGHVKALGIGVGLFPAEFCASRKLIVAGRRRVKRDERVVAAVLVDDDVFKISYAVVCRQHDFAAVETEQSANVVFHLLYGHKRIAVNGVTRTRVTDDDGLASARDVHDVGVACIERDFIAVFVWQKIVLCIGRIVESDVFAVNFDVRSEQNAHIE